MATLLPNLFDQFFDTNGLPLSGGKLYSYIAGTTTPQATFTDKSEGTPNTNPVILDANGRANVWIGDALIYKFILKDSLDSTILTVDNVANVNNGAISTAKLADGSVTTAKIADANVTTAKLADGSVTTAKIADANVTTAKLADGSVTAAKIEPGIDLTQFTNIVEMVVKNSGDFEGGRISAVAQWPWSAPALTTAPSVLPANDGYSVAWSSACEYLAVGHATSPYLSIYQRKASQFTKLADPGTLPVDTVRAVAFSPNSQLLAYGMDSTPFLRIYERQGSKFISPTQQPTAPAGAVKAMAWSPNGEYLAVAHTSSPYVSIYQRSADTLTGALTGTVTGTITDVGYVGMPAAYGQATSNTAINLVVDTIRTPFAEVQDKINNFRPLLKFSKLSDPASLPPGDSTAISWSPDSKTLAVGSLFFIGNDVVSLYSVSGSTFTKSTISGFQGINVSGLAYSPTGEFLAVAGDNGVPISIFQIASGVYTQLPAPAIPPTNTAFGVSWSPNGRYLAVSHQTSPRVTIYDRNGTTTFTKLTDPVAIPTSTGNAVAFSPDNQFLAVAHPSSPYIHIYKTGSTIPKNAFLYVREVPGV